MTDADWDAVMAVHLTGAYRTSRAAWPYFRKQKFGRIVNTSSSSGLYGNFGQSNYAGKNIRLQKTTCFLVFALSVFGVKRFPIILADICF
jgi:NADP-dependent 3-hydroxy acid dehydrogenase YdfG